MLGELEIRLQDLVDAMNDHLQRWGEGMDISQLLHATPGQVCGRWLTRIVYSR